MQVPTAVSEFAGQIALPLCTRGACAPEVGSSMKTMEGLATSSTAMVSRLRCSTDRPLRPAHGHMYGVMLAVQGMVTVWSNWPGTADGTWLATETHGYEPVHAWESCSEHSRSGRLATWGADEGIR